MRGAVFLPEIISVNEAVSLINDGDTIMIGGFMGCGTAHKIVRALARSDKSGLILICNDASMANGPDGDDYYGVAKLIHNGQIKKLYASHVGRNPEVAARMNEGTLEVVLIPQGSLAEMIRAGGAGLGGVITPTGVGTVVENSEHARGLITIDGKKYLIEKPLRADVSLINGYMIDTYGNIWYKGTTRNLNTVMATAADKVIAEADNLVGVGDIAPENIVTPGIFVDYIVDGGKA